MGEITATTDSPEHSPEHNKSAPQLAPLMFTSVSCMMAMMGFIAMLGPIARTLQLREWQAGASVTAAGVLWLLAARWWGRLCDRIGRKQVLIYGVGGMTVSYLAMVLALQWALQTVPAVWIGFGILLLGRGGVGLFYAAIPVAGNAMIADRVAPAHRTKAMAALGAATAFGMTIGPALAAMLLSAGLNVALWAMALPLVLAVILVIWFVRESVVHADVQTPDVRIMDPRLRLPVIVAVVATVCVTVGQICVGFYAIDRLGLDELTGGRIAGYAITAAGVALIVSQGLVRQLSWSPLRLISVGCLLAATGFVGVVFITTSWQLVGAYGVMAFGLGFVFPTFSALAANAVGAHEQGLVAGTVSSAQGLGMVFGPALGGALYGLLPVLPFLSLAGLLLIVAVIALIAGRAGTRTALPRTPAA